MPLDRDDEPAAPAAAPLPAPPSEFEQKLTKFLMRELPDSCIIKGVVCCDCGFQICVESSPIDAITFIFVNAYVTSLIYPNCCIISQVSSVMGGGMGFLFGGFMNSMEMRPYDHGRPMLALAKDFGKEYAIKRFRHCILVTFEHVRQSGVFNGEELCYHWRHIPVL
jgi:hypothetical protein